MDKKTGEPRQQPRLKLRVTSTAETILRGGHPWLFAGAVREANRTGETGELAVIYDRKDHFLAIGLFDADSPIRVRVLHAGDPVTINEQWWREQFDAALRRRDGLFDADTTGYRWIHGESDGWPGLVLDRYGNTLVLKLYTAAWLPRLAELTSIVCERLRPAHVVLRLSRNIQETAGRTFKMNDGQILHGDAIEGLPVFFETGIRFESDVLRGQKTGFFLDQRENRRRVGALVRGSEVLNAFSYSGGFSLYAARGGAVAVTNLDISAHALEAAQRNFALNQDEANVSQCRHEIIQADAFEWLEQNKTHRFDVVVLDPPSLAKRESERAGAIQSYGKLAANGIRAVRPGGVLVAASCSAHVSAAEFFETVREAARKSGRQLSEIETVLHPPDHPATFREAEYLKCIYLRA